MSYHRTGASRYQSVGRGLGQDLAAAMAAVAAAQAAPVYTPASILTDWNPFASLIFPMQTVVELGPSGASGSGLVNTGMINVGDIGAGTTPDRQMAVCLAQGSNWAWDPTTGCKEIIGPTQGRQMQECLARGSNYSWSIERGCYERVPGSTVPNAQACASVGGTWTGGMCLNPQEPASPGGASPGGASGGGVLMPTGNTPCPAGTFESYTQFGARQCMPVANYPAYPAQQPIDTSGAEKLLAQMQAQAAQQTALFNQQMAKLQKDQLDAAAQVAAASSALQKQQAQLQQAALALQAQQLAQQQTQQKALLDAAIAAQKAVTPTASGGMSQTAMMAIGGAALLGLLLLKGGV